MDVFPFDWQFPDQTSLIKDGGNEFVAPAESSYYGANCLRIDRCNATFDGTDPGRKISLSRRFLRVSV
jgi:hypothetical protein